MCISYAFRKYNIFFFEKIATILRHDGEGWEMQIYTGEMKLI